MSRVASANPNSRPMLVRLGVPSPPPSVAEPPPVQTFNETPRPDANRVPLDIWIVTRLWDVIRIPFTIDGLYRALRLKWIPAGVSFWRAHRDGFVSAEQAESRYGHCQICPHRKREWCAVVQSSCGCPQTKRWLFSKLAWRVKLRSFGCPIGRWSGERRPKRGD